MATAAHKAIAHAVSREHPAARAPPIRTPSAPARTATTAVIASGSTAAPADPVSTAATSGGQASTAA